MDDDTFIESLDKLKWTFDELERAKRLRSEGRVVFISGDGFARYVKPGQVKPWHDVIPCQVPNA